MIRKQFFNGFSWHDYHRNTRQAAKPEKSNSDNWRVVIDHCQNLARLYDHGISNKKINGIEPNGSCGARDGLSPYWLGFTYPCL